MRIEGPMSKNEFFHLADRSGGYIKLEKFDLKEKDFQDQKLYNAYKCVRDEYKWVDYWEENLNRMRRGQGEL